MIFYFGVWKDINYHEDESRPSFILKWYPVRAVIESISARQYGQDSRVPISAVSPSWDVMEERDRRAG
jgi:hypothetical protein